MEMSFADEEDVMAVFEGLMGELFEKVLDKKIELPIPRMEYNEAMERFGTDRPDTRFNMELQDITDIVGQSEFKVFQTVAESGGKVKVIKVEGHASEFSRKILDELSKGVVEWGGRGLAWIKIKDSEWQSPIAKFFKKEEQEEINHRVRGNPGDLLLIVADSPGVVNYSLGMLRLEIARRLELIDKDDTAFVWVTKFPLFEYDENEDRLQAVHHPFTAPVEEDLHMMKDSPQTVKSRAYDLVLNGVEIGGGSVRIHNIEMQEQVFEILGISKEEADIKFGFFLEALRYGAPPHAGMAIGFDRLAAIMTDIDSIREIIAFPKTQSATCPLTNAPSRVDAAQLHELALKVISEK
jgi:aspartyl-tRNA synthetase